MKYLVPLALLVSCVGCATVEREVGPRAAAAINRYCVEPRDTRLLLRASVNEMVKPNTVKIVCAGDPPE